jgi:3-oxoacyl-[acyl-carrier-protein] synthase-3
MYSRIAGTGSYLPERVVTNHDLEQMVDTTDEWIRSRTGIERRHVAAEGETTLDLSEHAARLAMEAAGVVPPDIDFLVIGTLTPDLVFPNVACLLQERMGIHGCPAFSLETACSGFVYGLSIADKFITTGQATCALVIGAETLSRVLDWEDRATCVLFGDGAGAAILQRAEEPGIMSTHPGADGQHACLLYHPYGPSKPQTAEDVERPFIQMRGNELFKVAVKTLERCVQDALQANDIDRSEIDWFVPHQANIRIIQAMAKRLEMPMEKVILTLQEHGNTSAASVPMALDVAVRDGRIKRGDLLLLETFGGGITWGSALIRY